MLNDALQRVEQMLSWLPPFGCIFDEKTIVIQREDELAGLLRVLNELGMQQPRAVLECGYYRGGTSLICLLTQVWLISKRTTQIYRAGAFLPF